MNLKIIIIIEFRYFNILYYMKKNIIGLMKKNNSNEIKENSNENIEENIIKEDIKESQNLQKIKIESENIYKENIKNNIIYYIKKKENTNINYNDWLKLFNKLDWELEFNNLEKRDNKIYHEIWDNITKDNEYVIIY